MISLLIWFCRKQQDIPALQFILNKSNQRCYLLILWALLYLILWNFPSLTGSSSSGQKLWKWQGMIFSGDTCWMCWLYYQRNKTLLYDNEFGHLAPDIWQTPEHFGTGWNLFLSLKSQLKKNSLRHRFTVASWIFDCDGSRDCAQIINENISFCNWLSSLSVMVTALESRGSRTGLRFAPHCPCSYLSVLMKPLMRSYRNSIKSH